jgi:hypothetical protein
MASLRWFRVSVYLNDKKTDAFFYETDAGLFDLQYGFGKYTTRMHDSLREAMTEFRSKVQEEHAQANDGVQVRLGDPEEVSFEVVKEGNPANDLPPAS